MILFRLVDFKIGVRRGHFLGDPNLSDRSDGDLLLVDLFLIRIIVFRLNSRLAYAIRKFITDKYDVSWHESINKAKNEAYKLAYKEGMQDAKKYELMYEKKIQEHEKEFKRLRYENGYLKEAFKILNDEKKMK